MMYRWPMAAACGLFFACASDLQGLDDALAPVVCEAEGDCFTAVLNDDGTCVQSPREGACIHASGCGGTGRCVAGACIPEPAEDIGVGAAINLLPSFDGGAVLGDVLLGAWNVGGAAWRTLRIEPADADRSTPPVWRIGEDTALSGPPTWQLLGDGSYVRVSFGRRAVIDRVNVATSTVVTRIVLDDLVVTSPQFVAVGDYVAFCAVDLAAEGETRLVRIDVNTGQRAGHQSFFCEGDGLAASAPYIASWGSSFGAGTINVVDVTTMRSVVSHTFNLSGVSQYRGIRRVVIDNNRALVELVNDEWYFGFDLSRQNTFRRYSVRPAGQFVGVIDGHLLVQARDEPLHLFDVEGQEVLLTVALPSPAVVAAQNSQVTLITSAQRDQAYVVEFIDGAYRSSAVRGIGAAERILATGDGVIVQDRRSVFAVPYEASSFGIPAARVFVDGPTLVPDAGALFPFREESLLCVGLVTGCRRPVQLDGRITGLGPWPDLPPQVLQTTATSLEWPAARRCVGVGLQPAGNETMLVRFDTCAVTPAAAETGRLRLNLPFDPDDPPIAVVDESGAATVLHTTKAFAVDLDTPQPQLIFEVDIPNTRLVHGARAGDRWLLGGMGNGFNLFVVQRTLDGVWALTEVSHSLARGPEPTLFDVSGGLLFVDGFGPQGFAVTVFDIGVDLSITAPVERLRLPISSRAWSAIGLDDGNSDGAERARVYVAHSDGITLFERACR